MAQPKSLDRFIAEQAVFVALFNATMNIGYTWWLWAGHGELSMFGGERVGADLAGTPVVIGFLSTIFGTAPARKQLRQGKVRALLTAPQSPFFEWLPRAVLLRSLVAAIIGGVVLGLPVWAAINVSGLATISAPAAWTAKVILTLVFSVIIVPCVIRGALADIRSEARTGNALRI